MNEAGRLALIRILLADDHSVLRSALGQLLALQHDMAVVGEAPDGRDALALVERSRPDLVVMDVAMPGLGGIEATRRIRRLAPGVRVLAVSQYSDADTVAAMLGAGASGFVVKSVGLDELMRAIRVVATGRCYLSPALSDHLVEPFLRFHNDSMDLSSTTPLTSREREVLQLIAEGESTRGIAERLGLSVRTVETHRHRLMAKLRIKSVAGLTKWAIRHRLTSLEA